MKMTAKLLTLTILISFLFACTNEGSEIITAINRTNNMRGYLSTTTVDLTCEMDFTEKPIDYGFAASLNSLLNGSTTIKSTRQCSTDYSQGIAYYEIFNKQHRLNVIFQYDFSNGKLLEAYIEIPQDVSNYNKLQGMGKKFYYIDLTELPEIQALMPTFSRLQKENRFFSSPSPGGYLMSYLRWRKETSDLYSLGISRQDFEDLVKQIVDFSVMENEATAFVEIVDGKAPASKDAKTHMTAILTQNKDIFESGMFLRRSIEKGGNFLSGSSPDVGYTKTHETTFSLSFPDGRIEVHMFTEFSDRNANTPFELKVFDELDYDITTGFFDTLPEMFGTEFKTTGNLTILIDRESLIFPETTRPEIIGETLFVPARPMFEHLGYSFAFFEGNMTATSGSTIVKFALESLDATVDNKRITLPFQPFMSGGITMVPLSFIADATGYEYNFSMSGERAIAALRKK